MNLKKISVIGLGKLGTPLAYFLASKGFTIYGYDKDKNITNKLNKGINPHVTENLSDFIKKYKKKVIISNDLSYVLKNTEITFIILPTPSLKSGAFDNNYIIRTLNNIKSLVPNNRKYHLINITSTVMPESNNKIFSKLLNGVNCKFGLVYNPHFIALGSVVNNMQNPDLLLIGSDEKKSKDVINKIYFKVYKNKKNYSFFRNLTLYEAEVAKIALNCYLTMKISFSNFISNIIQTSKIKSDAEKILEAISNDERIGKKYLSIGSKYSGPCFPRDNVAIKKYCKTIGSSFYLPEASDKENKIQIKRYTTFLKKIISKYKIKSKKVGVIGLSYKSNTDVVDDSPGIELIKNLNKKFKISYFDPYVKNIKINNCKQNSNLESLLKTNDIFFLCYPDKKFRITKSMTKSSGKKYIIDLWNFYNSKLGKNYKIFNPGKNIK